MGTMDVELMVVFHAATGAAVGSLTRSRFVGTSAGPFLHVAADRVPHEHPRHERWEYATGILVMGALVRRRGLFDPATIPALLQPSPLISSI